MNVVSPLQVVMAVAQLYHHTAPRNELSIVAKPLIRLLKSHSEVQSVVLSNIATISSEIPVRTRVSFWSSF